MVHSAQFGAQTPTRSPVAMPAPIRPRASASTSRLSSSYVQRRPVANSTSASLPPYAATVRSKFSPIVSSRRAGVVSPAAYDSVMGANVRRRAAGRYWSDGRAEHLELDAVREGGALRQRQLHLVLGIGGEQPPSAAEDHREDHPPQLVDEGGRQRGRGPPRGAVAED